MSTNWSTAPTTARTAGAPALIRFSAAPSQARSCASVAVAASTSDAEPVASAARSRSRSATAAAAAVNRCASAGRSASARSAVCLPIDLRQRAGPYHRAVSDAGDDGDTRTGRCRAVGCEVSGDVAVM